MNGPKWQRMSILDRLSAFSDAIISIVKICFYIFLLYVTVRVLWYLVRLF